MELKDMVDVFIRSKKLVLTIAFIFTLIGVLHYYYLPVTYKATGNLYVSRELDNSLRGDFTYEGYYAQQVLKTYTETLIGLLESINVRKSAIEEMNIPVTEVSLRRLKNKISTKKIAPQLVSFEVKQKNPELASNYWVSVVHHAIKSANELNVYGDNKIDVSPVGEVPVVHESYRNIVVSTVGGLFIGLMLSITAVSLREYFK